MAQKFTTGITVRNLASAASDAVAVSVDGDTNDRIKFEAGGKIVWGGGASAGDVNLYRSAADLLKTDDAFQASGVITLTTDGAPVAALPDGALAVDTTNEILYVRANGAWVIASGGGGASVTTSDGPPPDPESGDLWYETDTGSMFVYYDDGASQQWVEVGTAGVIAMTTSSTAPTTPSNGDLWFDTDTARTYVYYDDGSSSQWVEVGAASAAASGQDGYIQFATGGTFNSASALVWDDTNKRLGIGTTSPASSLELHTDFPKIVLTNDDQLVSADAYFAGIEMRDSNENFAGAIGFISGEDQDMRITSYRAGADLHLVTGGANNERVTITDTGNVGIGTTSPNRTLQVNSPAAAVAANFTSQHAALGLIEFESAGSASVGQLGVENDDMVFRPYASEAMRIASNGNVGINDTTPSYTLDVNGDINTTGAFRTDGNKTGLVLVGSGDFSGTNTVDILNVFTSEFDNYQLHMSDVTDTLQEWIYFRLWQGGTLNAGNNYDNQRHYTHITSVGGQKDVAISYGKMLPAGGNQSHWITHISSPALSTYTLLTSWGLYSDNTTLGYLEINNTWFRSTGSVTGIRFGSVSGSGTIAGRWELYGCPK